jgi:hypothetical protein
MGVYRKSCKPDLKLVFAARGILEPLSEFGFRTQLQNIRIDRLIGLLADCTIYGKSKNSFSGEKSFFT